MAERLVVTQEDGGSKPSLPAYADLQFMQRTIPTGSSFRLSTLGERARLLIGNELGSNPRDGAI
jgi:hypothetical protein